MNKISIWLLLFSVTLSSQLLSQSLIAPIGGEGSISDGTTISWTIGEIASGATGMNNSIMLTQGIHQPVMVEITSLENLGEANYKLSQNVPNPFRKSTVITINLPHKTEAIFSIYNITGKKVYEEDRIFIKGIHQLQISSEGFPAEGTYFYRFTSDKFSATKKMTLVYY